MRRIVEPVSIPDTNRPYCAFFDLDETLIRSKSMMAVLETYYRLDACSPADGQQRVDRLRDRAAAFTRANSDRRARNLWFYRQLQGLRVGFMRVAATHWFERLKPCGYHGAVLDELVAHQRNGATIVIVTGSFREAVEPVMRHLGIGHLVCADLEVIDGAYTGVLKAPPTIGQGKADALRVYLDARGLPLEGSYAYGDHDSDIPMLRLARCPVAVGGHPGLIQHAASQGWRIFHHLQEQQHGRP